MVGQLGQALLWDMYLYMWVSLFISICYPHWFDIKILKIRWLYYMYIPAIIFETGNIDAWANNTFKLLGLDLLLKLYRNTS